MALLLVTPPFLTVLGIVREKERGSIYNIYSSTVTRGEFLIGKILPYIGISMLNAVILWCFATMLFGAPFKGSFLLFLVASLAYVTCTTGIGLVVSTLVNTQVAAMIVTLIVTLIPAVLYSGVIVPVSSLSGGASFVAHLLPAMYYADIGKTRRGQRLVRRLCAGHSRDHNANASEGRSALQRRSARADLAERDPARRHARVPARPQPAR